MMRVAMVTGLVLFGLVGAANADGPGGWSQFNDLMAKVQVRDKAAPAQQGKPVYEFNATQQRSTSLFPSDPNERTND